MKLHFAASTHTDSQSRLAQLTKRYEQFDVEVAGKRILRETFCIGMPAAKRQMVLKYPVNILNTEHWTQKSVE